MSTEDNKALVRPALGNSAYTPSYEELRLAVRIIGIHAIVFPLRGEYPFRYKIEVRPPKIWELLRHYCVADDVQFAW